MKAKIEYCKSLISKISWLAPLLARLTIGVVFIESGWGKLKNVENVVNYFTSLGIPFPELQAPFVAGIELIGGLLLVVGLLSRLVSLPLIGVMAVAIITAKKDEISGITDIFGFSEFLYIVLLIWIVISGPGIISLDQFVNKKIQEKL